MGGEDALHLFCQTLSPIAVVARFFQAYRDEAEKEGYTATPDQPRLVELDLCRRDRRQGDEGGKGPISKRSPIASSVCRSRCCCRPAIRLSDQIKRVAATSRDDEEGKIQTAEDLVKQGVVIVGSPATVRARKLAEYQDLAGFGTSLTKTQFGTLPRDMTKANMRKQSPRKCCPISASARRRR